MVQADVDALTPVWGSALSALVSANSWPAQQILADPAAV
jgi:hypothetical protein